MFSFFKKQPSKPTYEESVWIEQSHKYQGLIEDVTAAGQGGETTLIFAHFAQTVAEVVAALSSAKIGFQAYTMTDRPTDLMTAKVLVVQADILQAPALYALKPLVARGTVRFALADHYPLLSKDLALLETLFTLAPAVKPMFYTSLEDETLKRFISGDLKQMLEKLGMKPDERINHSLVNRSIANAQEKIEKTAHGDRPARSAEEWMTMNL